MKMAFPLQVLIIIPDLRNLPWIKYKTRECAIFKFDGVGSGNGASGANEVYEKDINAFLQLINELRTVKPDLFFSLTVGTWPSPYWLCYGDAIWRAGDDTGQEGEGNKRQKWINYKDAETYKNVVSRAYSLSAEFNHDAWFNPCQVRSSRFHGYNG